MPTRTILVDGNGTNSLSFRLDGPDVTDVEAVLAEIDASGAGDTIATLLATSPAGSDVAAVPQGQPVSGGGQGRATWALRLAEEGGGSAPATPLVTTDGATVISPTGELFIGAGLELGGGGGVATIAERQVPFFMARAAGLVIPAGGTLNVEFRSGPFLTAWTNDVPAAPGYRTAEGASFVNSAAWTGDNFRASPGFTPSAFGVRPDRPGVYLVSVSGTFRALGGAGSIDVFAFANGVGQPRAGFSETFALQGSTVDYFVTMPLIYFAAPSSTVTRIEVAIANNSGQPSDPPNTRCEVTAYRLSPA